MGNLTLNGQTVLEQVGTSRPTIGAGFPNIGWKKLASYNWNTNTNYIDFDDVDCQGAYYDSTDDLIYSIAKIYIKYFLDFSYGHQI